MAAEDGLRQRKGATAKPAAGGAETAPTVTINTSEGHLGITLSNEPGVDGCVISQLNSADLCACSGLLVGDIVTKLNGKAVMTHTEAFEIINNSSGEPIVFEYITGAMATKARSAKKVGVSTGKIVLAVLKGFAYLLVLLLVVSLLMYKFAPQEIFQDHVDTHVLPLLGYDPPRPGYDGKPIKRLVKSKDPTKPWKVPGWNRAKENDALQRVKNDLMIKMMCPDLKEPTDLYECDHVRSQS